MTSIRQLHELQELDLEIAQRQGLIASVDSQLGDRSALDSLRNELASREAGLHELRLKQRSGTLNVDSIREKLQDLEGKLYGGAITNQRELESYEKEAAFLRGQLQQLDEEGLAEMMALEEAEKKVRSLNEGSKQGEEDWKVKQTELARERAGLEEIIAALESRRQKMVAQVGGQELKLYENLRLAKGGMAIAKVERGMCQVCRMALPTHQNQRVRTGREPVQCGSCGRILYLS